MTGPLAHLIPSGDGLLLLLLSLLVVTTVVANPPPVLAAPPCLASALKSKTVQCISCVQYSPQGDKGRINPNRSRCPCCSQDLSAPGCWLASCPSLSSPRACPVGITPEALFRPPHPFPASDSADQRSLPRHTPTPLGTDLPGARGGGRGGRLPCWVALYTLVAGPCPSRSSVCHR